MSVVLPEQAVNIRLGEELDLVKLGYFLSKNIPDFKEIIEIKQFPGGFSNLTYLIISPQKEFVLRRAPFGANIKNAHDMGREYNVLSILAKYYNAIPKVELFCDDMSVIGSPFYLMEKVDGIILRAKNAKNYQFEPAKWQQLSEMLIDNLATLHQIDIYETGLVNLGKPEGYVDRQVEGWTGRYTKSKTDEISQMDFVGDWLAKNKPLTQKYTFLHNDYKYDNVVLDSEMNSIKAVLDWEMATVGDPLMDLGASLAYWSQAGEGEFMKTMNITWFDGNLSRQQIVERYSEKTKTDTSNILFYYVFGLYKNAVIVQQIYARWKAGFTKDPRFEMLIFGVKECAKLAETAIKRNSI